MLQPLYFFSSLGGGVRVHLCSREEKLRILEIRRRRFHDCPHLRVLVNLDLHPRDAQA